MSSLRSVPMPSDIRSHHSHRGPSLSGLVLAQTGPDVEKPRWRRPKDDSAKMSARESEEWHVTRSLLLVNYDNGHVEEPMLTGDGADIQAHLAGYQMVDVEPLARAIEIAARASAVHWAADGVPDRSSSLSSGAFRPPRPGCWEIWG
jgi:hypothetical protein